MIPHDWQWKTEQYNSDQILLGIDAVSEPDEHGLINIISIQKVRGTSKSMDLESEFNSMFKNYEREANLKILESGKSSIFGTNSYFIHTKSDSGTYGEIEVISFMCTGIEYGLFYVLTASASQDKDLRRNMAVMIQCLKTFDFKMNN
mgnify:CR=1 FL=1